MKKCIIIIGLPLCFGCSNGRIDEGKLDAAGDKLQQKVEEGADSVGSKLERLKDKIDSSRRDTIRP
jgi:hypothetical protein